jgi:hypothetical protein
MHAALLLHEFAWSVIARPCRQQQEHDTSSLGPPSSHPPPSQNYETTFDVNGRVETVSTPSLKEDARSQRSISSSRDGNNRSVFVDVIIPKYRSVQKNQISRCIFLYRFSLNGELQTSYLYLAVQARNSFVVTF